MIVKKVLQEGVEVSQVEKKPVNVLGIHVRSLLLSFATLRRPLLQPPYALAAVLLPDRKFRPESDLARKRQG